MAVHTPSQRLVQVTYGVAGWGTGELVLRGERPVHHALPWPAREPSRVDHIEYGELQGRRARTTAERWVKRFASYLGGRRLDFEPEDFALAETCDELGLTELERAIAFALAGVRWGERVSYGELAARAGRPSAPRAAGAFCARCPLDLLLPAHRVVRSDGSLGEYGSHGVRYKQRLLALERAA
jgi:O-6-methylguanine DNA methyltransferase